jgi:hypothetical protein
MEGKRWGWQTYAKNEKYPNQHVRKRLSHGNISHSHSAECYHVEVDTLDKRIGRICARHYLDCSVLVSVKRFKRIKRI